MPPSVDVITPTWQRHRLLLDRCIPSVAAQTYPNVRLIVVSDGPDPALRAVLGGTQTVPGTDGMPLVYDELPAHAEGQHWGIPGRLRGLELAAGDLIAYLDDDDEYKPEHCAVLAAALDREPGAGFAYSRMTSHHPSGDVHIGSGQPYCGNIGTPMVMHRREILEVATWGHASSVEDWELIWRWIEAGITYVSVEQATVEVWPSAFAGG